MITPEYKRISERTLKKLNNDIVPYSDFLKLVSEYKEKGLGLYIGTDSQESAQEVAVVTCLVFYSPGKNMSSIFYFREKFKKKALPTLRSRMTYEAMQSIQAAHDISEIYSGNIEIHLDIGTDDKVSKSSLFRKDLVNMVLAQGYGCQVKPDSWASSTVADRLTRK
jgi:predicted RNase H-related nuclease YkuK (DUF458 family)